MPNSLPLMRQLPETAMPPLADSPPIITSQLLARCLNNASFACELLAELQESLPPQVQELVTLAEHGAAQQVADLAHAIKGAAGIVGAETLSDKARQLEAAGRCEATAELDRLVSELQLELQRCLLYLPAATAQLVSQPPSTTPPASHSN